MKLRKMLYVYNPSSGSLNNASTTDKVIECFQQHGIILQPYRIGISEHGRVGSGISLKDIMLKSKDGIYDGVVVSGGDGTLNFVANVMYECGISIPYGVIPAGTCNDFARSLGIPGNIEKCAEIIAGDNTIDVDIGILNGKSVFINTCAGGRFVNVSFNTNTDLKKNFGPLAYYFRAIGEVGNIKPFNIKITTCEGEVYEDKIILFIILNGKNAAGLNNIIREADMADGMMDIMFIRDCSALEMASLFIRILINESIDSKCVQFIKTRCCRVESSIKIDTSVDGEKGPELPMEVEFRNKWLKVWVPKL